MKSKCKECGEYFEHDTENYGIDETLCSLCIAEKDKEHIVKCNKCGKVDNLHYFPDVEKDLIERGLCFTCGFWDDIVKTKDSSQSVRVKRCQYQIGREEYKYPTEFRGFGGQRFHIKFNDGREVITTNLWCNGSIPTNFQDVLPDNAIFVTTPNQEPK